jgi:hypothetical protein
MSDEVHSCIQLKQQSTMPCASKHPDWNQADGNCPTCDSYESRLAELLGLSQLTNSSIPSIAASEGLREIAWESDLRFA